MILKYLYNSRRRKFIFLFFLLSFLMLMYFFNKTKYYHYKTFTKYKQQIVSLQKEIKTLKTQVQQKEKIIHFYKNKIIDRKKLKIEASNICNSLVETKILEQCKVDRTVNPLEFINVANIYFSVKDKKDATILSYFLSKIYNIKRIKIANNKVTIEIFKYF